MTFAEPGRAPLDDVGVNYMQWGPAITGALTGAAVALVLDSFGAAVGLAVTSTAPTWRDSSAMLQLLSDLYLVVVAIASFGVAGYLAGRMRKAAARQRRTGRISRRQPRPCGVGDCNNPDRAHDLGRGASLIAAERAFQRHAIRCGREFDRL